MPNRMILRVNHLWQIGLIGVSLWAAPIVLLSQGTPPSQPAQSKIEQPFSRVDDLLSRAADALLVSAAQTTVSAKERVVFGATANASPGIYSEPRSLPCDIRATGAWKSWPGKAGTVNATC